MTLFLLSFNIFIKNKTRDNKMNYFKIKNRFTDKDIKRLRSWDKQEQEQKEELNTTEFIVTCILVGLFLSLTLWGIQL